MRFWPVFFPFAVCDCAVIIESRWPLLAIFQTPFFFPSRGFGESVYWLMQSQPQAAWHRDAVVQCNYYDEETPWRNIYYLYVPWTRMLIRKKWGRMQCEFEGADYLLRSARSLHLISESRRQTKTEGRQSIRCTVRVKKKYLLFRRHIIFISANLFSLQCHDEILT